MGYYDIIPFNTLNGLTITEIRGAEVGSEDITFVSSDGREFKLYHQQDCCESVAVEDICGDVEDLLNTPILLAEDISNELEGKSSKVDPGYPDYVDESYTWTFYKLSTIKGSVTIRWYGSSNGYYSESVIFEEIV